VLGEYQPHKIVDGKRVPVGEVIRGYYPRIIEDDEFLACSGKANIPKGAAGDKISNLFGGLAFDGVTKASMKYLERPGRDKKYKYLYSDAPRLKKGAPVCRWNYEEFENLFLHYILGIDWTHVVEAKADAATANLDLKINALQKELTELKAIDSRFVEAIRKGSISAALIEENTKLQAKIEAKKKELEDVRKEKASKIQKTLNVKELRELIAKGDFASRVRLRNEIRKMIVRIDLYPNGNKKEKIPFPCFSVMFKDGLKQNIVTKDGKIIGRGGSKVREELVKLGAKVR
jgi:hypothetical protein